MYCKPLRNVPRYLVSMFKSERSHANGSVGEAIPSTIVLSKRVAVHKSSNLLRILLDTLSRVSLRISSLSILSVISVSHAVMIPFLGYGYFYRRWGI